MVGAKNCTKFWGPTSQPASQLWSCVWQEMSVIRNANKGLLVGEKWTRTKRRYPSLLLSFVHG